MIDERRHLVLASSHPSPLSATRGDDAFMKSDCFHKANAWLEARGEAPIDWMRRAATGSLLTEVNHALRKQQQECI